jgi:hypothetical protein
MKKFLIATLCAALFSPVLLRSDTLRLKDGSALVGSLLGVENDTVYFETSFGSTLRVPKGRVASILFVEAGAEPPVGAEAAPTLHSSEAAGTLLVTFDKFEVTSRIVVRRNADRAELQRGNSIEQVLKVNGKTMISAVDSTTDKVVRNGPETTLRNDAKPVDLKLPLEPGYYQCAVRFGSLGAEEFRTCFDPEPLEEKLELDSVRISAGQTTVVRVGVKRKAWRLGDRNLVRIE